MVRNKLLPKQVDREFKDKRGGWLRRQTSTILVTWLCLSDEKGEHMWSHSEEAFYTPSLRNVTSWSIWGQLGLPRKWLAPKLRSANNKLYRTGEVSKEKRMWPRAFGFSISQNKATWPKSLTLSATINCHSCGTSKTKELLPTQPEFPLPWKSHCFICVPA